MEEADRSLGDKTGLASASQIQTMREFEADEHVKMNKVYRDQMLAG